jgi:pimeloyl-ACP methyl ester carboxylesterase
VSPQSVFVEHALEREQSWPATTVRWHFRVSGQGPVQLLAFHGFSQSADYFDSLAEPLRGIATVWAMDMPAHGATTWPGGRPCRPHHLQQVLQAVKSRTDQAELSVLGFSMGGRFAMLTGQTSASMLRSLHLAAPEGLSPNWPQRFSTETTLGRYLINRQIDHPGMILKPIALMERTGLLSRKMADFGRANVATRQVRVQLKEAWAAMHGLKPDHQQLAEQAGHHSLPVHIYAGRKDPLMSTTNAGRLADRVPGARLHVLDRGHFLINTSFGEMLAGLL